MSVTLIGIDCSTNIKKNGLARGIYSQSKLVVTDLTLGSTEAVFISRIAAWAQDADRTLLCIDAPLGWPAALGQALVDHHAGRPLHFPANTLFRRETDKIVKHKTGKQPMDVGSNLIARTAYFALGLIEKISIQLGEEIPLAWQPKLENNISAIEVYPAATLLTHNLPHVGYKTDRSVRENLLTRLRDQIEIEPDPTLLIESDHVFDALVCLLAGVDFLQGVCIQPQDLSLARKEGWIWVRDSMI